MTPDEMRATAKALVTGAVTRLKAANLTEAEQVQVAVITDQVNGFVLASLADAIESLNPDAKAKRAKQLLAEYSAREDALRKAAAKGYSKNDWSDFDKLVDGVSDDTGSGTTVAGVAGANGST